MTNRNIKEFDPLRGRMNPKILIVLSTGWGSTSLTQQPAAIQRLDPPDIPSVIGTGCSGSKIGKISIWDKDHEVVEPFNSPRCGQ